MANTWAMPLPIVPAPTTPTLRMSMDCLPLWFEQWRTLPGGEAGRRTIRGAGRSGMSRGARGFTSSERAMASATHPAATMAASGAPDPAGKDALRRELAKVTGEAPPATIPAAEQAKHRHWLYG